MTKINDTLEASLTLTNDELGSVLGGCHRHDSGRGHGEGRGGSRGGRRGSRDFGGRRGDRVDVNNEQDIDIDVNISVLQNADNRF